MTGIWTVIWAEGLKVRKSRMLWLSVVAAVFIAAMLGVSVYISNNPGMASKLGLLGTKSSMVQNADWPDYLGLLTDSMAALGLIGFGFVASWMFGREYSDRTVKDLLALPFPRSYIVIAKLVVGAAWGLLLSLVLLITALIVGGLAGLSGGSASIILNGSMVFGMTMLMTLLVSTPVAFFASYGRGYLPPIGFAIITLIAGQFIGTVGLGPYFPWAIPGLYSVAQMSGGLPPGPASYILLALTGISGTAISLAWWRFADQH